MRILFVPTLSHPEVLVSERRVAQQAGRAPALFPSSTALHFWEKALLKQGYTLDVFWRNLPANANNDPSRAKSFRYQQRWTPQRVVQALQNRLPAPLNPSLLAINRALVAYAQRTAPNVIWLTGDNRVITADTLAYLKRAFGCKILYTVGTSPIVFSGAIERESARLFDWVLCNDFYHGIQWQELGAKNMVCLPIVAIDPEFHRPRTLSEAQRAEYACDVSFVGTLVPNNLYSERVQALEALRDFKLGVWSVHEVPESLKAHYRGQALGDTMMDVISASVMTLNTHGDFMRYGGNMRLFEAAGVGAFQICDDRVGIKEWFTVGEHLVTFSDLPDLRDKVAYYLAHPAERQRIIEAARAHVLAHHTYEHRLNTLRAKGVL